MRANPAPMLASGRSDVAWKPIEPTDSRTAPAVISRTATTVRRFVTGVMPPWCPGRGVSAGSELGAAVRAEHRARLVAFAPAAAAADLQRQRRAARRAELAAVGLEAAARAGDLGAGVEVEVGRPVLLAGLVPDLVA